jgi:chromate transport protein ChrA
VLREWGRIGCIGFGGPPAHIALLRELCVTRRGRLDDREFEDAIAATNLLPGPASTLMQHDAVDTYHWMTDGQFLNAVALGQVTSAASRQRLRHPLGRVGHRAAVDEQGRAREARLGDPVVG